MDKEYVGRKARVVIRGETVEGTIAKVEQPTGVGGPGNREPIVEVHFPLSGSDPVRYGVRRKLSDVKLD
jgi:hypothetical protein